MVTRLNAGHRDTLNNFARQVVDAPDEQKVLDKAYNKAAPLVLKVVEKEYPEKDMVVLKKYECASRDACIDLKGPDSTTKRFLFKDPETAPYVAKKTYYGKFYLADAKTYEAVEAWHDAKQAVEKVINDKLSKLRAFIRAATNFEQVLEVWPEAKRVALHISKNLPVALNDADIASITADSLRRLKNEDKVATADNLRQLKNEDKIT